VTEPTGSGQFGAEDTLAANQIDAAPSFSYAVRTVRPPSRTPGTTGTTGATGQPSTSSGAGSRAALGSGGAQVSSATLPRTGLNLALPLTGLGLLLVLFVVRLRQRPHRAADGPRR